MNALEFRKVMNVIENEGRYVIGDNVQALSYSWNIASKKSSAV